MKKFYFMAAGLLCLSSLSFAQNKRTVLSATIDGYKRDMVYFDCVQSPFIRQEFHANPGEEHVYSLGSDRLVSIIINGRTNVLLMPGDSLHVDIQYQGKMVKELKFSGSERAVADNELYAAVGDFKRSMRYKSQLLACGRREASRPYQRFEETLGADQAVGSPVEGQSGRRSSELRVSRERRTGLYLVRGISTDV